MVRKIATMAANPTAMSRVRIRPRASRARGETIARNGRLEAAPGGLVTY
jgi:hypothetical protein